MLNIRQKYRPNNNNRFWVKDISMNKDREMNLDKNTTCRKRKLLNFDALRIAMPRTERTFKRKKRIKTGVMDK